MLWFTELQPFLFAACWTAVWRNACHDNPLAIDNLIDSEGIPVKIIRKVSTTVTTTALGALQYSKSPRERQIPSLPVICVYKVVIPLNEAAVVVS